MAGKVGLLRNVARGLARHACMLACRGRNRLLLMILVGVEHHETEPQSIETPKSDDHDRPFVSPHRTAWTAESQLARRSLQLCTALSQPIAKVPMCSKRLLTERLCVTPLQAACHR